MAADKVVTKGDAGAVITWSVVDASGVAVDLTGATVRFIMRAMTAVAPVTNLPATIVNGPTGAVSYTFTAADTALAGQFQAAFRISGLPNGLTLTSPIDGYLEIIIEEDLVTATPIGRLVGLGETKDHLRIPAADRSQDAALIRYIDALTPVIENITGPIIQRRYQGESYDGGSWFISLRHRPVISIDSVVEYRGPIPYVLTQVATPDAGSVYSYMFEPSGRIVRRTVGGGITPFPPGADQVIISYTAGFAVVPANIRMGTLEAIRENFQPTEQGLHPAYGGRADPGEAHSALGARSFLVSDRVRQFLIPNKRHPSVA